MNLYPIFEKVRFYSIISSESKFDEESDELSSDYDESNLTRLVLLCSMLNFSILLRNFYFKKILVSFSCSSNSDMSIYYSIFSYDFSKRRLSLCFLAQFKQPQKLRKMSRIWLTVEILIIRWVCSSFFILSLSLS